MTKKLKATSALTSVRKTEPVMNSLGGLVASLLGDNLFGGFGLFQFALLPDIK